nr:12359_t:CDS:2 [Entrophospora candida]
MYNILFDSSSFTITKKLDQNNTGMDSLPTHQRVNNDDSYDGKVGVEVSDTFWEKQRALALENTQHAQCAISTQELYHEQLYLGESNHQNIDDNNTDMIETENHDAVDQFSTTASVSMVPDILPFETFNNDLDFNPEWIINGVDIETSSTNNITSSQPQFIVSAQNADKYLHIL